MPLPIGRSSRAAPLPFARARRTARRTATRSRPLRGLLANLEAAWAAAAFGEENDAETARQLTSGPDAPAARGGAGDGE